MVITRFHLAVYLELEGLLVEVVVLSLRQAVQEQHHKETMVQQVKMLAGLVGALEAEEVQEALEQQELELLQALELEVQEVLEHRLPIQELH